MGHLAMEPSTEVTLFLIEDDDVDAMSIERSFAKQRIRNQIVRAHDGIEALEFLKEGKVSHPFIILLDLQMPRMTGLEFLKELRGNAEHFDAIVFVLTTSKADQDLIASYNQFIAGYFVKDNAGENFIDVVNALDSYWKILHLPSKKDFQ
jgi:CheY-like chemotaxis protein